MFSVANNINEFLQLVATLRGTQLIDLIPLFKKEQFEKVREEHIKYNGNLISKDIADLTNKFNIVDQKMSAYDIVMELYNNFDYSTINFTPLYYETLGIDEK